MQTPAIAQQTASTTPQSVRLHYLDWLRVLAISMVFVGMRFLDFSNKLLEYGQEAVLPFFVVHQPVIIVIAYVVVQWNAGIPIKLVTVVLSSFVVCVGIYELIIRRVDLLRAMFGMKSRRLDRVAGTTTQ